MRRILCVTQRGVVSRNAVRQADAIAASHDADLSFFTYAADDPVSVVLRRARAAGADLIVLEGADPESRAAHFAEAVVRHAPCPVLAARPSPASGNVLVASDLLDPDYPAVGAAVDEAERRSARLLLVHVVDSRLSGFVWSILTGLVEIVSDRLMAGLEGAARDRMADALGRYGAEGETILAHGAPAASVLKLAVTLPTELVVIGAPGETSIRTLLFGSVVETVVRWAPCNVLVVPVRAWSETSRPLGGDAERLLERESGAADRPLVEEPADQRHPVGHAPRR